MTVALAGIRLAAVDVERVAGFWAGVLGWSVRQDAGGVVAVLPLGDVGYPILVAPEPVSKPAQNRIHLDITSSSAHDMARTVQAALALGGSHVDIGQGDAEPHKVLADPEGNEFCVIEPGNRFLADTGRIGALNCDGTRELGHFWSRALGWPLVWDRDGETAIQAPTGGTKVTWSGPPLMPRPERERLSLEIATSASIAETVALLTDLGAAVEHTASTLAQLLDPDGNRFRVVAAETAT